MPRRRTKYNSRSNFEPTRPIQTKKGIKAHSQHGAFAKNWWATRWIEAMERLVDARRLSRGRTYARKGQVLSIEEHENSVAARVQGSRRTPYKVTIQVAPLDDAHWEKVVDALAEQALFTAQLLAGEMPQEIEDAFKTAGVSLFPTRRGDLTTSCSCPDWSNPCKHVAATHYILGERFDEDPFLLFRLRGRSQEQILQGLRQRRAGQDAEVDEAEKEEEPEVSLPLEESLAHFWQSSEPLEQFSVNIKPPAIEVPLLKRLGEPAYAAEPGLQYLLLPALRVISQTAIQTAFGEE
ncbi:MAG: SWIM zinc finger family protein [Chloroflexota bacterium]